MTLIRCAGWSAPLLFACNKTRVSRVEPHILNTCLVSGLHAFLNVLLFHTQVEKARARLHICTHSSALPLLAYATANAVSLSMQVEKAHARLRKCLCSKTQICLLVSSIDNFCKQIGTRPGRTKGRA